MTRLCPECLKPVIAKAGSEKTFCVDGHRHVFHNRAAKRGKLLAPLLMAARITRGGSRGDRATGRAARQEAERLMQRWVDEDREKKRMSAVDYIAQRRSVVPTLSDMPTDK
jgi:hypothetical protein